MQTYRTEGIILQALNFQDYDQILTVFAPSSGIIKLIVKGAHRHKKHGTAPSPMTCGEFVYTQGRSEILKCEEFAATHHYPAIRNSISSLEAACDMMQAILDSQLPHTPAPDLYNLLVWSLGKLSFAIDPYALATSFRLKVLKHDGLLNLQSTCSTCGRALQEACVASGETLCPKDAPPGHFLFPADEFSLLSRLLQFRVLAEVADVKIHPQLRDKVKNLFSSLVS